MQRNVSPVVAAIVIIAVLALVAFIWARKTEVSGPGVRVPSEAAELTEEQTEARARAQESRSRVGDRRESRRGAQSEASTANEGGEPGRASE